MFFRMTCSILGLALAACASPPAATGISGASGYSPPLAEGSARLRIVRSGEAPALPLPEQIRVAGKFVAELDAGGEHLFDLPAGPVTVTATHRMAAANAEPER